MQVNTKWTIHVAERHDDDWLFWTEEFPLLELGSARQRYHEHRERLREEVLTEWELALTDDYGEPVEITDKAMEGAWVDDGAHESRTIDHPGAQKEVEDRYTRLEDDFNWTANMKDHARLMAIIDAKEKD